MQFLKNSTFISDEMLR